MVPLVQEIGETVLDDIELTMDDIEQQGCSAGRDHSQVHKHHSWAASQHCNPMPPRSLTPACALSSKVSTKKRKRQEDTKTQQQGMAKKPHCEQARVQPTRSSVRKKHLR